MPKYLDTIEAYNLWSEVYDKDGNFLQAVDTEEMKILLPKMMTQIKKPAKIIDLGCGTGRNTKELTKISGLEVIGLDGSEKMLDIARSTIQADFQQFDFFQSKLDIQVDGIISTLVIEHIPVKIFFDHVSNMLKPQGILLITNMHSDMGKISQAGFIDPKTGEKIRPKSYVHTIEEIQSTAKQYGFELIDQIEEREITEESTKRLGLRSKKWIGIKVWFGGIFKKTPSITVHDD